MCIKGVNMFSPDFMRYLINYQKKDFAPEQTVKEIKFKNSGGGKLAEIYALVKSK